MKIDIDHYKICHVNNYSIQKKKIDYLLRRIQQLL